MEKRGQSSMLSTTIAIVLGIALVAFLIFGFTRGWGNLWDSISNLGGGDSNVDDVVTGCEVACTSQSQYAYCSEVRTVKLAQKVTFSEEEKDVKEIEKTCNQLSQAPYASLGIKSCPAISCP